MGSLILYFASILALAEFFPSHNVSHVGAFMGGLMGAFIVIWPQDYKPEKAHE
jgi:hypothetical protein